MKFLVDCMKGIAIGAGAILPGISSGVLLVVFGLYENLIHSIVNFFENPKKNFRFLCPIFLGCFLGIILLGNVLTYLFSYHPIPTKYSFIGLILGSLPVLFKCANQKNGFHLHYLFYLAICLFLTLFLLLVEQTLPLFTASSTSFFFLVLSGFLMSIGVVVPGVSSSVILMLLGIYDTYLAAISSLNFSILIPMGIGLLLGGFLFLKLIQICLKKYASPTYYAIIGFVLGSTLILFPGFCFDILHFFSVISFVCSFFLAYCLEKK